MDEYAIQIVNDYIKDHFPDALELPFFDVFIVWKCHILQNEKYLIATNNKDGMYYELTFNGDNREWYLDAYKKEENVVITQEEFFKRHFG